MTEQEHTLHYEKTISIEKALDQVGCGPFQYQVLLAAGLCFAADSLEVLLLTFLSPILKSEWGLTSSQSAGIVSAVFAGAMFGTIILGSLGDVYGRRPIYLISAGFVAFFGFATCLATTYASLVGMRFFVGFGIGGLVVPFDILAEFLPMNQRGKFLLYIEFFWTLGSLSVPIIAYWTIGMGASWVVFVFLCSVPCFVGTFMGFCLVPESPRWLVSQGRTDEALVILRKAAIANGHDGDALFPEGGVSLKIDEHESSSYGELFKPKWRRITFLLWAVWFGLSFCYYGTIMVVTRAFQTETNDDEIVFNFSSIFISSTAEVLGTILVISTVDILGRIASQVLFYSLGGTFVLLLCLSAGGSGVLPTFFAFFARVFEMAATSCTWVTTAEVFGTEVRTTGHSSANAMARLAGVICPFMIESDIPLPMVGFVLVVIHGMTVVTIYKVPETRGEEMGHAGDANENTTQVLMDVPEIS